MGKELLNELKTNSSGRSEGRVESNISNLIVSPSMWMIFGAVGVSMFIRSAQMRMREDSKLRGVVLNVASFELCRYKECWPQL